MAKNYYDILGVNKDASKDEIKKAFRVLAHKHHPDKTGGDATKFKEASEAYAVLSDDQKRAQYDQYGNSFTQTGETGGNPFGGFDFSGFTNGAQFGNIDFGDIFDDFFGGGSPRVKRGRDISVDIDLSFEESIFGTEKNIKVRKTSPCSTCKGTGGEPTKGTESCKTCGGNGKIKETKRSFLGSFATIKQCPDCHGSGSVPKEKCTSCKGSGITHGEQSFTVSIPSGVENGETMRLSQVGEAISGGIPGDLYVQLHVKKHQTLSKSGEHLTLSLPIKLTEALLGTEIAVQTLDGEIIVKIPSGVTHEEVLRIKGKGVPINKNKRGDLLITIVIQFPKKLSKAATTLIKELQKEGI